MGFGAAIIGAEILGSAAIATVAAAAIEGLIVGAVVGAIGAAVSGGNILEGALHGAVGGLVTGAVLGVVSVGAQAFAEGGAAMQNAANATQAAANGVNEGTQLALAEGSFGMTKGAQAMEEAARIGANAAKNSSGIMSKAGEFFNSRGGEIVMKGLEKGFDAYMQGEAADANMEFQKEMADKQLAADLAKIDASHKGRMAEIQASGRGGGGGGGGNHDALTAQREKIAYEDRIRKEDMKNQRESAMNKVRPFETALNTRSNSTSAVITPGAVESTQALAEEQTAVPDDTMEA